MRSFHFPGRSTVHGTRGMIACSHPLASQAGIEMLRKGGNAIDAAITATAVMCVVEPAMTGIGGDCFTIIAKPGQKPVALNGSGRAPRAATADWYARKGITQIATQSPHAVTIPGAVDAWATLLKEHGRKSFAEVLAPAIEYAGHGFAVAPRVAYDWETLVPKIRGNAGATMHLLKDNRAPRAGEVMRFPALAETLKRIARDGRDGFYAGETAADIVAEMREMGGLHTLEDLAAQRCSWVEPISVRYKGVDVLELPPANQGIVALLLLKMLERLGPLSDQPVDVGRYHVMTEAVRLAYVARDRFVADPDMAKVPVAHMLSDAFADELVRRIDRRKRKPDLGDIPEPKGSDTIYMCVADDEGTFVSFINSIFSGFGSGIVTRKTGIVLQNRGQGFVLDPRHRNCIAPGKRPLHTLIPGMMMKDGRPHAAFGVMGGQFQSAGHVLVVSNMLDYGLDPQEAIDSPRLFHEGGTLWCEESIPESVFQGLAKLGHPVARKSEPWGGSQMIMADRANGTLIGASDPRKDGMAIGY